MQLLQPPYFERIRQNAHNRWNQLEDDEELAGPWHTLFDQVKDVQYVISELLQNAEDAEASEAEVKLTGDMFIFEHNGKDFSEDEFGSLCRFAYSNKRTLHTIGFRGIGFKSTFSVGEEVYLRTPTLSVVFNEKRFTEPVWRDVEVINSKKTRIAIKIRDPEIRKGLESSVENWKQNTSSLIFFNNIKKLTLCGDVFECLETKTGPVKNSEYRYLSGLDNKPVLKIISEKETFPEEALEEIRRVRKISNKNFSLPPVEIELIFGIHGRQTFYVVLPTKTRTDLHFSINAPFLLTPDRKEIINPRESPTNRWILEKAGEMLIQSINEWVHNPEYPIDKRVRAYNLLPKFDLTEESDIIIKDKIKEYLKQSSIILDMYNRLVSRGLAIFKDLYEIWDSEELLTIYSDSKEPIVSKELLPFKYSLSQWGLVRTEEETSILKRLSVATSKNISVPRPKDTQKLTQLWVYIYLLHQKEYKYYSANAFNDKLKEYRLIPVTNSSKLYAAEFCIRKNASINLLQEKYQTYIYEHLHVCDEVIFNEIDNEIRNFHVTSFLRDTSLDRPASSTNLVKQLSGDLYSKSDSDLITITHIAALLNATIPEQFYYINKNNHCTLVQRPKESNLQNSEHKTPSLIIYDPDNLLDGVIDTYNQNIYSLNNQYYETLSADEEKKTWNTWAISNASCLLKPFQIVPVEVEYDTADDISAELEKRHAQRINKNECTYKNPKLVMHDYGLHPSLKQAIRYNSEEFSTEMKAQIWERIFWNTAESNALKLLAITKVKAIYERSRSSYKLKDSFSVQKPDADWIYDFKTNPCLFGTDGFIYKPDELYFENEATKSLKGLVPFIHPKYASIHPLLEILGVRKNPGVPRSLIRKLTEIAKRDTPKEEIFELYRNLDSLLRNCNAQEIEETVSLMKEGDLVYTDSGKWVSPSYVYRTRIGSEEISGIYYLPKELEDLALWGYLRIRNRPEPELLLSQLEKIEPGKLSENDLQFVTWMIKSEPNLVLKRTGKWIDIRGKWEEIENFSYYLKHAGTIKNLKPDIAAVTADFSLVNQNTEFINTICELHHLLNLNDNIHWYVSSVNKILSGSEERREWTKTFGRLLTQTPEKYPLSSEIREFGSRLEKTTMQPVGSIFKAPFLKNEQIGDEISVDIFWDNTTLYYLKSLKASQRLTKITDELAANIRSSKIQNLIRTLYEKDNEIITEICQDELGIQPLSAVFDDTIETEDDLWEAIEDEEEETDEEIPEEKPEPVRIEDSFKKQDTREKDAPEDDYEYDEYFGVSNVEKRSNALEKELRKVLTPEETEDTFSRETEYGTHPRNEFRSSEHRRETGNSGGYSSASKGTFDYSAGSSKSDKSDTTRSRNTKPEPDREMDAENHARERQFLYQEYHGKCQICGVEPFYISREHQHDFIFYFEAVNLVRSRDLDFRYKKTEGTDGWNALSLCPACAAKYKYATHQISSILSQIQFTNVESRNGQPILLDILLDGKMRKIKYSPAHFLALKKAVSMFQELETDIQNEKQ